MYDVLSYLRYKFSAYGKYQKLWQFYYLLLVINETKKEHNNSVFHVACNSKTDIGFWIITLVYFLLTVFVLENSWWWAYLSIRAVPTHLLLLVCVPSKPEMKDNEVATGWTWNNIRSRVHHSTVYSPNAYSKPAK